MGDIGSKDEPVEEEYGDVETGLTDTPGRRSLVGSELIALELAELSAELAKLAASGALSETQLASSPSSSRSWQDVGTTSGGRRRMPRHAPHRRTHSARASLTRHVQGTHATLSVSRIRPRARPRSAAPPRDATHRFVPHHTVPNGSVPHQSVPNCSMSDYVASLHVTSSEDEYGRGMGADDSDGSEWSMSSTKESDMNLQVEAAAFTASGDVKQTIQSGSEAEVPPMGQFLLPLITGDSSHTATPHTDSTSLRIQLVQHKRILEALVSDGEATRNNFIQEWKQQVARTIETERLEAEKGMAEGQHKNIPVSGNSGQQKNSELEEDFAQQENSGAQDQNAQQGNSKAQDEFVQQETSEAQDQNAQQGNSKAQDEFVQQETSEAQDDFAEQENFPQENLVDPYCVIEQDDSVNCEDSEDGKNSFECESFVLQESSQKQQNFVRPHNLDHQQKPGIESIEKLTEDFVLLDMKVKEMYQLNVPKTSKESLESSDQIKSRIVLKAAENLGNVGTSLSNISHSKFRALRFFIKSENSRRKGLRKKTDYKTNYEFTKQSNSANDSESTKSSDSIKISMSKISLGTDPSESEYSVSSGFEKSHSSEDSQLNCVPKIECCDAIKNSDTTNSPASNESDSAKNLVSDESEHAKNSAFNNAQKANKSDIANITNKTDNSNFTKPECSKNVDVSNKIDDETENFRSNKPESSTNSCDSMNVNNKSESCSYNVPESAKYVSSNIGEDIFFNYLDASKNVHSIQPKSSDDGRLTKTANTNSNKPESLGSSSAFNEVYIETKDSDANNRESSNSNKPESSNSNKPKSSNLNKPESSNSNKPESSNANKPESLKNASSSNTVIGGYIKTEDSHSNNPPEPSKNLNASNHGDIETKDFNSNKPESSNSKKPESFNSNKPESSNSNKPESSNLNKPEPSNSNKAESSNSNKPEFSSSKKPESSSSNKPQSSSSNKPDSSSSSKAESSSSNKPESSSTNKPESSSSKKPESSSSNEPESSNSNKPESLKNLSANKSECSSNCALKQDLPSLVEALSSIVSDNLDPITEEISSDYEYCPETKFGRVKGRQCRARASGAGPSRSGAANSGIRAVTLRDVTAVLHYVFQASRPPPLNEMKLISTDGFSHQWRQYYECCSILTCSTTSREAGLTDSEWHLRLQYGRCYCCICMFRIHNRCAILDYADFIVTQLVMAGRQTTVDAAILLRQLELNKPNEELLMIDYGRKCEYVMTHGVRLVSDSSKGKHSTDSTQLDLQTYHHRRPPVRKNIRERKMSVIAEHVSELGLRIMASRLMEFMNVDHRLRDLLERGCCCRPFVKVDLPPDNSMLGKDGTCKWALEALVNLYDGFSYHDTRALFKMDLINTGGNAGKVQAVNASLNAGHREWERRYYAKLYSQFSHRSVHSVGPIVSCATCRCLCRTRAVFDTDYKAGVTNSRLMQSMKNSLSCERAPDKYGMNSLFDIAMPNDKNARVHRETEMNSFLDKKIRDLIRTYFLCADHSQYDRIYNIERNTKKNVSEKMFRRNNVSLANKHRPANDLCEAALEQVFTIMETLVKSVDVAQVEEIEDNKENPSTSSKKGKRKGVGKKTKCAITKSKSKRTRKVVPSTQEYVNVLQVKENMEGAKTEVIDGLKTFEEKLKTAQKFMEAEIRDMLASRNIPVDKKNDAVVLDYSIEDLHEDMDVGMSDETALDKTHETKAITEDQVTNDMSLSVPISDVSSNNTSLGYDLGLVSTNSTLDMSYLTANTTFSTLNTTFTTPNTTFTTPDRAISTPNARSSVFNSTLSHDSTSTTLVSTPATYEMENQSLDNCTMEEIINDDRKVEQMIKEATADPQNIENVVNALLSTVQGVNDSLHDEISKDMSNLALDEEEIEILQDICQNCHIEMEPNERNVKKCKDCIETDNILFKYLSVSDNLPDTDAMHGGSLDAYAIDNIPEFHNKQHSYNLEATDPSDSKVTANANRLSKTDSEVSDNDFVDVDDGDFVDDDDSDGEDLNDMIRDLLRSVNSIEVVMDTVMAKCRGYNGKLDMSKLLSRAMDDELLALLDEKLIELYRHMPGIHKRQMAVWRRQEKWTQFVWQGEWPPSPSPPRTPPPPPPARQNPVHAGQSLFAVCPGYHVARFREVRRKLVHMIEQQKYFDHIRNSLERKLTPPRKKSPDNSDANTSDPIFDFSQSDLEQHANELYDLSNSNFDHVERNSVHIMTCKRVSKAVASINAIGSANEIDEHQIYTVERSVNVEDSIKSAINMNEHIDFVREHKNNTEFEFEYKPLAETGNSEMKRAVSTANRDDNVEEIKKNTEDEVTLLHENIKSIAEDAKVFETMCPTASTSKITHANNTLERLCGIVDRAKEIGVFQKEIDVNEHAKRVVKHGRSVIKRGENIQKRTEMMLDKQIKECLESTLAEKQKSKKASKFANKKSSSKTKVKNRRVERNAANKMCEVPKSDVVARSSIVDRSSELNQISGADSSFEVVRESFDDGEVGNSSLDVDKVSDIVKKSEVDQSSGVDQCYIDQSCLLRSKVAESFEPDQSSGLGERSSEVDRNSGDHISADYRENTKQGCEDSTTETNANVKRTTPIITMRSIYQCQSPLISQVHMGRVMNCARRTSAANKSKIRRRVLPCNSLIPIQPLHMGPFDSYRTPYMEKKEIKNTINDDDVSTNPNGVNDNSSLDTYEKSKKERIGNDRIMGNYSEAEFKENWSDLEKMKANIEKYEQLHSQYLSEQSNTQKEINTSKKTENVPSNSEESIILKRFLSKVNDLSQKYMVVKSNEVDPPEVFQYSDNNDEVHSDSEIFAYNDESVLSPPLQEISPNKNDVAVQKNMKIAFNTNLTKVERKVGAFSKLLYQSGEMVERVMNELASCDQIRNDLNLDAWIRESECVNDELIFLQKELSELDLDISTIEYVHDDSANYNILKSFEDELKKVIKECLSVLTENQMRCDFTNVFCVHGIVSKSSILIVKNFIDRNEDVDFSVIQCIMVELVEKCLDMIDDRSINQIDILPSIQKEITEFISAIKRGEFVMPDKIMFDINSELKEWKYYLNDHRPSSEKVRTRKSPPKKNRSKKLNEELRTILFSSSNLLEAMNEYVEKGEIERFKDSTYTQKEYNKWIANFSSYIIRIRIFNYIGVLYKNYLKASREGRLRMSLSNLMNYILPKDRWIGSDEFTPGFKPEDASRQINVWLSAWRKFVMYKISGPEIGRLISEKERVIKSSILKSVAKGRANSKAKDIDVFEKTICAFDKLLEETYAIEERSKCCQTDTIENFDDGFLDEKYCLCTAVNSEIKNINTSVIEASSTSLDSFVFGTQTSQTEIRNKFAKRPRVRRIMNLFWDYIDIVLKVTENPKMPKLILENADTVLGYIQNKSCLKYGLHVESNLQHVNNTPSANASYFIDSLRNINMHIYVNILEKRRSRLQYNILLKKLTMTMYKVGALFRDRIEGKPNISIQTCSRQPCNNPSKILSVIPLLKVQSTRNEEKNLDEKGVSKIITSNTNQKSIDSNQSQINNVSESWYNDPDSDNDDSFDFFLKKNNIVIKEFKKRVDLNENSNSQGIFIEEIDTGMMFFKRRKRQVKLTDCSSDVSTVPNTEMDSDDGTDPDILEITDSDDEKDEFNDVNTIETVSPNVIEDIADTQFVVNEKIIELQNRELSDRKMHVGIEVIHESQSTQTDLRVVEEKIEELCKGLEAASVSQEKSKKSTIGSANGVQKATSKKSSLLKTVAKQIDPKSLSQSSLEESSMQKHERETALYTAAALRSPKQTLNGAAAKQMDPKSLSQPGEDESTLATMQKHEREIAKYTAVALRNAKQTLNAAAFDSIQANQSKEVLGGQNQGMKPTKDQEKAISSHRESLASKQQSVIKQVANKQCDKPQHHVVCKAGHCHTCPDESQQCHVTNGVCTCCYCTIFGHASLASSTNHSLVSSKLGETRERLRTLLHKKRQNFKAQGESPSPSSDQKSQTDISEKMSNMNIKECSSRHTTSSESSPGPDIAGNTASVALSNVKCQVLPSKCHIVRCKAPVRCQCQLVKTRYQHSCPAAGNNWGPQKAGPAVRPAKVQGTARLSKAVIQRKAQGLPSPRAPPTRAQQGSPVEIDSDQKISKAKIETALDLKPYTRDAKQNETKEKTIENIRPNTIISQKTGVAIEAIKKTEEIVKIMEDACKINEESARNSQTVARNANSKAKSSTDTVKNRETIEMNNSFEDAKRNPRLTANSPVRVSEKTCNCENAAEVSKKCIHTGYTRVPIQAYATSIQNQPTMTPQSPCLENHSNLDMEEQMVPEDTRDLNQLLEYIEGPIKGVDKGKKKAKKARQKAKKMEQRLMAEQQDLIEEMIKARKSLEEKRIDYESTQVEFDEVRRELRHQQQQLAKKKGKSKRAARPSPTQQALIQTTAEKIGKITMKLNNVGEVYLSMEHSVSGLMSRLASCNLELRDVRRDIGDDDSDEGEGDGELEGEGGGARGGAEHDMEADPPLQHEEAPRAAPLKASSLAEAVKTLTAHAPAGGEGASDNPLVVTIRRGQQGVTLTWAGGATTAGGHDAVQLQHQNASSDGLDSDNKKKDKNQNQKVDVAKKPSWESALSQINELAKPAGKKERKEKREKEKERDRDKDKKKKSKDKPEEKQPKSEEKISKKKGNENKSTVAVSNKKSATSSSRQSQASDVCEEITLTKKQRKQARRQEAEQKLMATFQEEKAKEDLRHQGKGQPAAEERGENDKALSKGVQKLQKQQLNSANHQLLLRESQKLKQQNKATKDNRSRHRDETNANHKPQYQAAHSVGTSHSSATISAKPVPCGGPGGPGACSIMEQLTCGVQVADLRLPPGITLTRVDPNRQTNAKPIPSKPTSELLNPIPPPTLPSAHLITGLPPNASQAHLITGLTHTQAQINAAQAHMLSGLPPSAPQAHLITGLPANASQAYLSANLPNGGHVRAAPQGASYVAPNVVVLDPRSKHFEYQSKIHIPDAPPLNCPKGKKGKKKGKKPNIPQMEYHTTKMYESEPQKAENAAPKMVTLKNPMFFSNQSTGFAAPDRSTLVADGPRMNNPINSNSSYNQSNIPMASNNCQATITPTSNGMYTIRNPMMQLLHKNQNVEETPMKNEEIVQTAHVPTQKYASVHTDMSEHGQISINPIQSLRFTQDSTCQTSPKQDVSSNTSSTKSYEGYSLFKNSPNDNSTVITANPSNSNVHYLNSASDTITTGYGQKTCFSDVPNVNLGITSVFSDNLVKKVEPIGTPPKRNEEIRTNSYYTPFGTDRNLRSAIFQGNSGERHSDSKAIGSGRDPEHKSQELATLLKRLTVGAHLNDEVTIHSVTESKFYKPEGMDAMQSNNGSVEITLVSNSNQSVDLPYQCSQNPQPISSAVFNRSTKNVWAVGNTDLENVKLGSKAVESLVMAQNMTPSSMYESTSMSTSTSDSPAVSDGHYSRAIGEKQQEMTNFPIGYQTRRPSYEATNYVKQRTQEASFGERNSNAGPHAMNERSDLSIAAERLRDLGMTERYMFKEHQNFKDMGLVSERSLYGHDSNENVLTAGERSIYSTDFRSAYGRDMSENPVYKDMNFGSERPYNQDPRAYGNTNVRADRIHGRDLGYNTMERTSFTAATNECMGLNNDLSSNMYGSSSGYTISGTGINQETLYGRIEEESHSSYASQPTMSQRLLLNGLRRSADDNATTYYGDSVFAPNQTITNLNELDSSERDIESFKRFDFYFDPPKNKPKINLNVQDIALQLGRNPNAKDSK